VTAPRSSDSIFVRIACFPPVFDPFFGHLDARKAPKFIRNSLEFQTRAMVCRNIYPERAFLLGMAFPV